MRLSERDKSYLWDMEDACQDIITFLENTTFRKFSIDKMKRFAVERQLIVVGEAANHLSKECTENNPQLPWKLIIGLRNIIAHEYGEILVERIYKIAKEDVPKLPKIPTSYNHELGKPLCSSKKVVVKG